VTKPGLRSYLPRTRHIVNLKTNCLVVGTSTPKVADTTSTARE
jgi:hypothetical protein